MFFTEVEALTYLETALNDEPEEEGCEIFRALMIRNEEVQNTGNVAYMVLERRRTAPVAIQFEHIAGIWTVFSSFILLIRLTQMVFEDSPTSSYWVSPRWSGKLS